MITKFGSLYAGHVDLDNIGFDGTPVNDRWLSDEHLASVFGKAEAIVTRMDELGYDVFWAAEHRFQREGYECIPNLLMLFVHLAHLTKNIKLGCGFNVTPMWHPLRLAEDFAVADRLTGGRIIFGVGRGYHSRECEVLGAPSTAINNEANRELFEDQVEIIMKAFNNRSFSHHSKFYDIPPKGIPYRGYELEEITLVPRPRTLPVECWQPVVSATQRGMDFMAKHGIKGLIGGGAAAGGATDRVVEAWRDALARVGRDTELGADLAIGFTFHIAESEQKAIEEARPYFEENMKMFAPLGFVRGLSEAQIAAIADPRRVRSAGLPTLEQAVQAGSWLCGPPELISEKIQALQERYPALDQINVGAVVGTPQRVILEQLEIFAKEVMPTFKNQVGAATPAD
jgi:alkanesulfonate monooxygenase SsuD/methylene tetrahydromethanopterin reductase-like flavin-dependent oxidoreductase (luciferase family)